MTSNEETDERAETTEITTTDADLTRIGIMIDENGDVTKTMIENGIVPTMTMSMTASEVVHTGTAIGGVVRLTKIAINGRKNQTAPNDRGTAIVTRKIIDGIQRGSSRIYVSALFHLDTEKPITRRRELSLMWPPKEPLR